MLCRRYYRIGPGTLLIQTNSTEIYNVLELPESYCIQDVCSYDFEVFVINIESFNGFQHFAKNFPIISENEKVIIQDDSIIRYGDWFGRGLSVVHSERSLGICLLENYHIYNPKFISRYIFRPFLDQLLHEKGIFAVHGACCDHDGRGLLLIGHSGSGKSTTLRLIMDQGGWSYVSEDRFVLSIDRNAPLISGFPESACDSADPSELYGDERSEQTTMYDMVTIDPRCVFGDAVRFVTRPSWIVFPVVGKTRETAYERISKKDALLLLIEHGLNVLTGKAYGNFMQAAGTLVEQADCYRVTLGTSTDGVKHFFKRFVNGEELLEAFK